MTNEKIQEYTLRITSANKSELVVILCEMLLDYLKEAEDAAEDSEEFVSALRHTKGCVRQLIGSLNRQYDIANALYELYRFAERQLNLAQIRRDKSLLLPVRNIFEKLKDAFTEMAAQDDSGAVMKNTQPVYAGMTYGRNQLNESMASASNRGFFA